jgi:hypothetical protein
LEGEPDRKGYIKVAPVRPLKSKVRWDLKGGRSKDECVLRGWLEKEGATKGEARI